MCVLVHTLDACIQNTCKNKVGGLHKCYIDKLYFKKSKFLLLNSLSVVDSLFILGPPPVLRWANKSSCTFFKVSLSINLKVKKKPHVFMLRIETLGSWFKKKSSLELEKFSTKALSWWRFFFPNHLYKKKSAGALRKTRNHLNLVKVWMLRLGFCIACYQCRASVGFVRFFFFTFLM